MKLSVRLAFALASLFCLFGSDVVAQETTSKPNVFIDYFWRPNDVDGNFAEMLRSYVIESINDCNRVELIDVDSRSALAIEKSRRESGNLAADDDLSRLAVMKEEGANALIQGRITSLAIKRNTMKDGSVYYTAVLTYVLKAINPNDGKLISSKTINVGNELLNMKTYSSTDEAAMGIAKDGKRGVRSFIEETFPLVAKILEPGEIKKDEIKTMYISIGSDAGAAEGNKFTICVERQIAGRTSHKIIGECEIKAIEGGDISLAEVKKGGKELKEALDSGQDIVLKSVVRKERAGIKF